MQLLTTGCVCTIALMVHWSLVASCIFITEECCMFKFCEAEVQPYSCCFVGHDLCKITELPD